MRTRAGLFRLLQQFFEEHLRGVYAISDVAWNVAEDAVPQPGRRRWAEGKLRDIVAGRFGDFEVHLASSQEVPPLGRVTFRYRGELLVAGVPDMVTFRAAGEAIKHHHQLEGTET